MEPFKEVELIKELRALGTGSRAEMSKTALEQNRAELGNYFYKLARSESLELCMPAAFRGQFTKKQELT